MVRHWAGTENNSPDLRLLRDIDEEIGGAKSLDEQNEAKNNINKNAKKEKGRASDTQRLSYATVIKKRYK